MGKARTMRWIGKALAVATTGGVLVGMVPQASAQRPRQQRRVVIVRPAPVFVDPFFAGYPYDYPFGYYEARNYGQLKVDTHDMGAAVYIDGGFAEKIKDDKKFTLQPGNHEVELRDSDGRTIFRQRVAVMVDHTTEIDVRS